MSSGSFQKAAYSGHKNFDICRFIRVTPIRSSITPLRNVKSFCIYFLYKRRDFTYCINKCLVSCGFFRRRSINYRYLPPGSVFIKSYGKLWTKSLPKLAQKSSPTQSELLSLATTTKITKFPVTLRLWRAETWNWKHDNIGTRSIFVNDSFSFWVFSFSFSNRFLMYFRFYYRFR